MQKEREQRAGNLVRETPLVEKFFVAGKNIEEGARALHPGEHRHIRTWRASRGKEENERGSNGDKERKSCDRPERERERSDRLAALTRPSENGERLEGGLQFGTIVFLGEGAEDDQSDGVDNALLAQDRRGSVVPRRCLDDLH